MPYGAARASFLSTVFARRGEVLVDRWPVDV